jgi:adenosylcobinamide-phosphate synthase
MVDEPMINGSGRAVATIDDIDAAVGVFYGACTALALASAVIVLPFLLF